MDKNYTAEEGMKKFDNNKRSDAKKSLSNYVGQLKMHFDLSDQELVNVLECVLKSKKNTNFFKKWWHIWQ